MFLLASILAATLAQTPQPVPPTNTTPSAPQPPEEIPEVEETVVVTATRSNRRLQDEPLRVEVIDREEIEEKALMTPGSVAMLLGETTGLRVQTTAPSLGGVIIRFSRGRAATASEMLFNLTSQTGADVTFFRGVEPRNGWSWTVLG